MALHPANNTDPCGGVDNELNGCMVVFPRMEPGGTLCMRCTKLHKSELSEDDRARILSFTQCGECGVCGSIITDPCGTCRRANHSANQASQNSDGREDAARLRAQLVQTKMHKGPSNGAIGMATNLQELQAIKQAQDASHKSSANHFTIYYECRRSDASKTDHLLGTGCLTQPETVTMLELQNHIVKEVNGRWTEHYSAPLLVTETSLRAPKNYVFHENVLGFTLTRWFQFYSQPQFKDTFIIVPKTTNRKGSTKTAYAYAFSVELYIHVGLYCQRTEDPEIIGAGRAGTKRKTSGYRVQESLPSVGASGSSKRSRGNTPASIVRTTLRSSFVPDDMNGPISQTVATFSVRTLKFKKTLCTIERDTGKPTILEEVEVSTGQLAVEPLALLASERGRTKDIFRLQIGDHSFAAKKLVDVGQGRADPVSIGRATDILIADLIRLKRMAHFAHAFRSLALEHGVDLADFDISEAFVIKIYETESPSCDDAIPSATEVYLVEPFRINSAVIKYSGTLGASHRTDHRSSTLAAFAHFVAQDTACQYVFADIQGSNNITTGGKVILTLFDPMTHTPSGGSGLGDHGVRGLQDFIKSHTCSGICRALQLVGVPILQNTLDAICGQVNDEVAPDEEDAGNAGNNNSGEEEMD